MRRSGALGEIGRYLVLSAGNAVISTSAFYGLSLILPASVAFTIVYVAAIAYLAVMTPRFVFRARLGLGRTSALVAWYVCVYLTGLLMICLLGHVAGLDRWAVTLGTVAVTSPMSFIGSRLLVGGSMRQMDRAR